MTQIIKSKVIKNLIKRGFLFFFFIILVFGGYFLFQFKNYFSGPKIALNNLKEWTKTSDPFFEIKGTAKNFSEFYLNGRKIFTRENGFFKEDFVLASGLNIVQLKAHDKFGHKLEKYYYVVYKKD